MNAPRRLPFTPPAGLRYWLSIIVVAFASISTASARDDADNPARQQDDNLTASERAEPERAEKPWQERRGDMPAFPRAQTLIPFRADTGDPDYSYYIDVDSVSLAADEVLRYTVIIQSPVGSSNIIYEGIRCATEEVKMIAYGTRDGRFAPLANPKWQYFYTPGAMGYRKSLVEIYVCDENGWALDADTVLERLVTHDPRRPRFVPKTPEASE